MGWKCLYWKWNELSSHMLNWIINYFSFKERVKERKKKWRRKRRGNEEEWSEIQDDVTSFHAKFTEDQTGTSREGIFYGPTLYMCVSYTYILCMYSFCLSKKSESKARRFSRHGDSIRERIQFIVMILSFLTVDEMNDLLPCLNSFVTQIFSVSSSVNK